MVTKQPEMMQPDLFCKHTIQQNTTTAGLHLGLCCESGAYSVPPDPLAVFKGLLHGIEGMGIIIMMIRC